jgi:hypothetical protein
LRASHRDGLGCLLSAEPQLGPTRPGCRSVPETPAGPELYAPLGPKQRLFTEPARKSSCPKWITRQSPCTRWSRKPGLNGRPAVYESVTGGLPKVNETQESPSLPKRNDHHSFCLFWATGLRSSALGWLSNTGITPRNNFDWTAGSTISDRRCHPWDASLAGGPECQRGEGRYTPYPNSPLDTGGFPQCAVA